MKVGLISDTHNQGERTAWALGQMLAAGAEVVLHCGDITQPRIVHLFTGTPTHFVPGNNDRWQAGQLATAALDAGVRWHDPYGRLTLAEQEIVFVHGDDLRLLDRLLSERPAYLIHGHTHFASDTTENGVRVINPGALKRARVKSCAVLDLSTGQLESIVLPDTL